MKKEKWPMFKESEVCWVSAWAVVENQVPNYFLPHNFDVASKNVMGFLPHHKRHLTLPTYCGSDPMYSSSTKNWFHTQPRLTRWNPAAPFLIGPTKLLACSRPVLLRPCDGGRKKEADPSSTRIHRNSSRQFLVSIGNLWDSGPPN